MLKGIFPDYFISTLVKKQWRWVLALLSGKKTTLPVLIEGMATA